MAEGNGAAPGGFRSDPTPPAQPEGHSLDSALEELQRRRKRRPTPPPAARETEAAPAAEAAEGHAPEAAEDRPLPSPFDQETPLNERPAEPGEAAAEDEAEGHAPPAADGYFTVMLDGQPRQVPASELIAGYMRSADYTRKTQAATAQQQQFADAFSVFSKARTALEERLARFTTEASKEFEQPVDWVTLARTDPMGWAEKRARFDALKEAEAEQGKLAGLRQAEDQARKHEMLQLGHQVLVKAIPGWKDAATRTRLQTELKEYAAGVGYSAQELAADILDPRQLIVLHEAMQYRRLAGRRVTPQPPAAQPTMDRGGRTPAPQPTRRQQEAETAFGQRPSVDNALAVLKARQAKRSPPRTH